MSNIMLKIALIVKKRWMLIIFAAFVLISLVYLISLWSGFPDHWTKWIDPISSITTLAIAAFVWLGEWLEDWEHSLPKRLTASFLLDGKEIMRCENAYLAGESDVRAWGQQLGMQMAGASLAFDPLIHQEPGEVTQDPETNETIKLYKVIFDLTYMPTNTNPDNVVNIEFLKNLKEGNSVLWKNDPTIGKFKKKYISGRLTSGVGIF